MKDLHFLFSPQTEPFPFHLSPKPEDSKLVEARSDRTLPCTVIPEGAQERRGLGVNVSPKLFFFNFIYLFIYLFGCVGSSFLCKGFL